MADTIRRTYIQVRYLAFSLCIFNGTAALLSAGDYFTETFAAFGIPDVWQIFLLAILLCTATAGTFILIGRAWSFDISLLLPKSLVIAVCALGGILFTTSLITASILPKTATNILITASGIILAIGYIAQFILWCQVFSTMPFRKIAAHIGFSSAIAALAALAVTSLSYPLLIVIAIALSPTAAGLLIPCNPHASDTPSYIVDTSTHDEESDTETNNNANNSLSSLWPVFTGVALCISMLISMWRNTLGVDEFPLASIITRGTFFGFILCALVIGTLALMFPSNQRLRKASIWLCPLFAVLILIPCIFTVEPKGIIGFVLGMCTGVGLAFFLTLPLALFCFECGTLTKNSLLVLGLATLSIAGGGLIGIVLSLFADSDQATIVSTTLFIVYLVAIALAPKSFDNSAIASTTAAPENTTPEDPLEIRCAQIAEHYSLTTREAEIFSYLAHGRSATYTAKELYVSAETVKVHIKHIYEKLGVHSRDELLNLVQNK